MPLSAFAFVIGAVLVTGAGVGALFAVPMPVVVWSAGIGALFIIGTIFERVRYKALAPKPPGPEWIATDERFRDPATDRWVQVYFKPTTGERSYVEIDPPSHRE